jgi:hypothetical protein
MVINLLRGLAKTEVLMAPPEAPKMRITIVFVVADGRPTDGSWPAGFDRRWS